MNIEEACKELLKEECIILPSDTIYGLAALAYSQSATNKIYTIKERELNKQLPIHYYSLKQLENDVIITPLIKKINQIFYPGALTIIVNKKDTSKIKTEEKTIGIRIPNHPLLLEIIKKINQPITMTSANKSGQKTSNKFEEISKELNLKGIEDDNTITDKSSTIIDITKEEVRIIREGQISKNEIEEKLKIKITN